MRVCFFGSLCLWMLLVIYCERLCGLPVVFSFCFVCGRGFCNTCVYVCDSLVMYRVMVRGLCVVCFVFVRACVKSVCFVCILLCGVVCGFLCVRCVCVRVSMCSCVLFVACSAMLYGLLLMRCVRVFC